MTFKERLFKEHPDEINPHTYGGCNGCPYDYGYERMEDKLCKKKKFDSPSICVECWNREIPEDKDGEIESLKKELKNAKEMITALGKEYTEKGLKKAYLDGVNDGHKEAWKLAQKITNPEAEGGYSIKELNKIFGPRFLTALTENSYKETKELIDKYTREQEEKEIHVGDVVRNKTNNQVEIVVTHTDDTKLSGFSVKDTPIFCEIFSAYTNRNKEQWEKTGRHVDLKKLADILLNL